MLIDHPKTMAYINEIIQERPTINNSEIRLRYPGNQSGSHQPGMQQLGPPTGKFSRRRDCHVDDTPSPCLLKRLLKGEGGAAE